MELQHPVIILQIEKKSLPFYKFGDAIYLKKIETSYWIEYICSRFKATGKEISSALANMICQKVDNHSSYVQQLAWLVWIHTDGIATEESFDAACEDIIDQNTPLFEKQTENLTTYQMNFLKAVLDGCIASLQDRRLYRNISLAPLQTLALLKEL